MVIHTCPKCQKQFNKKSSYVDHIKNKKKPCKPKIVEITQNNIKNPQIMPGIQEKLSCKYCLKKFSRIDSLKRHMTLTCKVIKLENEKKQNAQNDLIKIDDLKKRFDTIMEENKNLSEGFDLLKKQNEELNNKINELLNKNINNNKLEDKPNVNKTVNKEKKIIIIEGDNKQIQTDKPIDLIINDEIIVYREPDKYINATQLCKAGGKNFSAWYRLDSTKELINQLKKSIIIPDVQNHTSAISTYNKFIERNKGGNNKDNQNTWIHPDLAIQLAQLISPHFALQVSSWIRTLFSNSKVEVNM